MKTEISKAQIDRLGDRLRKGNLTDSDLRLLDEYRRSFTSAYEKVVGLIRRELEVDPTGRPAKSTTSIGEKLRRESIRLSQIQDISGCRLIVAEIADQDFMVAALSKLFPTSAVIDRRQKPSHGYRAVHVVATIQKRAVEIQVRTALQQLWAELSEKLSDLVDPAIKYGGGSESIQRILTKVSALVIRQEDFELRLISQKKRANRLLSTPRPEGQVNEADVRVIQALQERVDSHQEHVIKAREVVLECLKDIVKDLSD